MTQHPSQVRRRGRWRCAFTLIELLIVMAIAGVLAAIGIPAMKGMGQGRTMEAGTRQFMSDLSLARMKAIANGTTVYMVFAPTNLAGRFAVETDPRALRQLSNLVAGAYSSYVLIGGRSPGEQPGRGRATYLTEWKRLPNGVLIAPWKYSADSDRSPIDGIEDNRFLFTGVDTPLALPFPVTEALPGLRPPLALPFIAFNSQGQLEVPVPMDEQITLVPGTVWTIQDPGGGPPRIMDVEYERNITNRYVRIVISALTGRTTTIRPELP